MKPTPLQLNFDTRRALMFALTAERLSAYYEHGQWMTDKQGATLAQLWLSRSKLQLGLSERRQLSELSDEFARTLAGSLSREAGLYTAHEMTESLDPNYASALAHDLLEECTRRLHEAGVTE
ncbi:hypothetical protein PTE30175_01319 [Pandoraea terrae]|uniref:Uncharacterized protein n=1 Tax=Pandoraea terrae TaxID=1537710 RepID=A0A5E4TEJ1_9BURK|nr:hypothetical protein [Pandoraea terrae]VVD86237.1 hypothetical protein PTE30175_01319 [Pandoraea terrae]